MLYEYQIVTTQVIDHRLAALIKRSFKALGCEDFYITYNFCINPNTLTITYLRDKPIDENILNELTEAFRSGDFTNYFLKIHEIAKFKLYPDNIALLKQRFLY